MPGEFEGDLAGAVFWGADLTGATFRDVDLTGTRISHAFVVDVEIDAQIERLVVNGVDVTAYVAEHDPWSPLRSVVRASEPDEMLAGWDALDAAWTATMTRALSLPDERLHESVDGEWSFVQTLRHLVFAMDKWFTSPVLGEGFHPIGLPNTGSIDFPWPDIDRSATPSAGEVMAVRDQRASRFREALANLTVADMTRSVDVLENGPHPLSACVATVLEEEFWHLRYADRDLARLETR